MGAGAEKKRMVERMFDDIAPTYDMLNHVLSLCIDRGWRRRVVKMASSAVSDFDGGRQGFGDLGRRIEILDVATGTGDLAIALARRIPKARITGADISENMLAAGREKVTRAGLEKRIVLRVGDAENLEFPNGSTDIVTVAFGVRNFGDIEAGLREMCRVVRPGGRCMVLEFSEPRGIVFGRLYRFYFHRVLPLVGRAMSKSKGAYSYLPRSVDGFPAPERFCDMMREAGFSRVTAEPLTGGVAWIYTGVK